MPPRKSKHDSLVKAKKYADILLYQATNGTMGKKLENEPSEQTMTFAEKKGLLDTLIKIAAIDQKIEEPEQNVGFAALKGAYNDSRTSGSDPLEEGEEENTPHKGEEANDDTI